MEKIIRCFCLFSVIVLLSGTAFAGEIHQAVKAGEISKIKSLLDGNPQLISEKDEIGKPPMYWAALKGRSEVLILLLDFYHGDVNILSDNGATPLHAAASQGHPECVKILLEHGAYINARNNKNFTPLHSVALNGRKPRYIETAKMLIDHGVDLNAETDSGLTALNMAVSRKNAEMEALLRNNRAKFGSGRGN